MIRKPLQKRYLFASAIVAVAAMTVLQALAQTSDGTLAAATELPPPPKGHYSADDVNESGGGGGDNGQGSNPVDARKPMTPKRNLTAAELEEQQRLAEERAAIRDRLCNGYNVNPDGLNLNQGGNAELCDPSAPPPAVANTPEAIADYVYVSVQGMLPRPEVHSNPDPGVPSIIHVPVFVEVTNWQPVFTDQVCDRGLCVTVTATPQLTYNPGEPGSTPVTCQGAGSRYDPNSDLDPDQQAAGACAYAYTKRTGTAGRPQTWPGQAIVTWTINWTSTSGRGGPLPPVTLTADIPKSVIEVQALLED